MTVLLSHLWPALAAAACLGLVFAAVFGPGRGLPSATLPVRIGMILVLVAAALVSGLSLVPGRPGLWFDIVVLTVWAYAIGVLIGSAGRWWVRRMLAARHADAEEPARSA